MALAKIGATEKGGVCRIALTELDRQGRDLFTRWAREAGCEVRVDAIGNIFARRAGRNNALPPVTTGSHIDTQPTGGKFDGNYGVLAGLEVVRALNDAKVQTEAPIEVAVWTNEEGSRFVPVMMGSGVFIGEFTLEHALAQRDTEGVSVSDALQAIGYAGSRRQSAAASPVGAYFEAHIEQGPVLEANDTRHRRGRGRARPALVRRGHAGHGGACRPHADGTAPRRAAGRRRPRHRGEPHRAGARAACARHGRLDRQLPELAQRDPRPREAQRRPARGDDVVLSAMDAELKAAVQRIAEPRARSQPGVAGRVLSAAALHARAGEAVRDAAQAPWASRG
jgi:N-carbamoyl-L-amino-acid hydrolase